MTSNEYILHVSNIHPPPHKDPHEVILAPDTHLGVDGAKGGKGNHKRYERGE